MQQILLNQFNFFIYSKIHLTKAWMPSKMWYKEFECKCREGNVCEAGKENFGFA